MAKRKFSFKQANIVSFVTSLAVFIIMSIIIIKGYNNLYGLFAAIFCEFVGCVFLYLFLFFYVFKAINIDNVDIANIKQIKEDTRKSKIYIVLVDKYECTIYKCINK